MEPIIQDIKSNQGKKKKKMGLSRFAHRADKRSKKPSSKKQKKDKETKKEEKKDA